MTPEFLWRNQKLLYNLTNIDQWDVRFEGIRFTIQKSAEWIKISSDQFTYHSRGHTLKISIKRLYDLVVTDNSNTTLTSCYTRYIRRTLGAGSFFSFLDRLFFLGSFWNFATFHEEFGAVFRELIKICT